MSEDVASASSGGKLQKQQIYKCSEWSCSQAPFGW